MAAMTAASKESAFGRSQGIATVGAYPAPSTARNASTSASIALAKRATRRLLNVAGGSRRQRSASHSTLATELLTAENPNMPPAPANACARPSKV